MNVIHLKFKYHINQGQSIENRNLIKKHHKPVFSVQNNHLKMYVSTVSVQVVNLLFVEKTGI
jgi:hypothetical protein